MFTEVTELPKSKPLALMIFQCECIYGLERVFFPDLP